MADTTQGPIINSKQLTRVERIVSESLSQGAVLELGGSKLGNCFQPTVLTGAKGHTTVSQSIIPHQDANTLKRNRVDKNN